jgi:AraC-like DNA-binding protein
MIRKIAPTFAGLVREFFTDYMVQQRALSPRTVASYRDTFVLLLGFGEKNRHLPTNEMTIADLNARFLADFLDHLETNRHNTVRSRNVRLAAIRSFLKFAARRDSANLGVIESALSVPMKRFERKMVGYLTRDQMIAVIDVPTDTWITTIAHDLGFPSSQYFSQVFRRNIGMTPGQWRRSRQHSRR